jgi:hypothetical protein
MPSLLAQHFSHPLHRMRQSSAADTAISLSKTHAFISQPVCLRWLKPVHLYSKLLGCPHSDNGVREFLDLPVTCGGGILGLQDDAQNEQIQPPNDSRCQIGSLLSRSMFSHAWRQTATLDRCSPMIVPFSLLLPGMRRFEKRNSPLDRFLIPVSSSRYCWHSPLCLANIWTTGKLRLQQLGPTL